MRSTYGLNIVYVRASAIFSTPRCRYPMTHSRPRTFSPSSRKITRNTPWVAGCCGPILMTSSFASRNVLSGVSRSSGESEVGSVIARWLVVSRWFLLSALNSQVDLYPLIVLLQNSVVFAQRMSLPSIGQQNPLHVRMAVELDAEHVEDFALQPVGGRPDGDGTGDGFAVRDLRFHADAFVARERVQHPDHVELLVALGVMHGGDIDAVVETFFIAQYLQDFGNHRAIDHHIVLPEISQRLDAGAVLVLELRDHGRIPGRRYRNCGLRRRRHCRFGGGRSCRSCRCGFWRNRGRSGRFVGSGFCF